MMTSRPPSDGAGAPPTDATDLVKALALALARLFRAT
jgi:hypothetical protein